MEATRVDDDKSIDTTKNKPISIEQFGIEDSGSDTTKSKLVNNLGVVVGCGKQAFKEARGHLCWWQQFHQGLLHWVYLPLVQKDTEMGTLLPLQQTQIIIGFSATSHVFSIFNKSSW